MSRIFVLMGKSATGKDSVFAKLREMTELSLKTVIGYTTRPVREQEQNGREYFFVSVEQFQQLQRDGRIIEARTYHTIAGDWHYFTADDGQIKDDGPDVLFISTLEGYRKLQGFYGMERVIPFYLEVEDGTRLSRSIERERRQKSPNYEELCRRFLADAADFSEDKLTQAGITKRYRNDDLNSCVEGISSEITKFRKS